MKIPAAALLIPVKRRLGSAFLGTGQRRQCLPHTQHDTEPTHTPAVPTPSRPVVLLTSGRLTSGAGLTAPPRSTHRTRRTGSQPPGAARQPHLTPLLPPGGLQRDAPLPAALLGPAVPPPGPAAPGRPRSASAASHCRRLAATAAQPLPARRPGARFPRRRKGFLNRAPRRRTSGPGEA